MDKKRISHVVLFSLLSIGFFTSLVVTHLVNKHVPEPYMVRFPYIFSNYYTRMNLSISTNYRVTQSITTLPTGMTKLLRSLGCKTFLKNQINTS